MSIKHWKQICVYFFVSGLLFLHTGCQSSAKIVKGDSPEIKFETATHDFGKVRPGESYDCEFKFRNIGNALLKINGVAKTCGCNTYTLEKKEYQPGETGVLKVKYNASGNSGEVQRFLVVYSNAKTTPFVKLMISANVVSTI